MTTSNLTQNRKDAEKHAKYSQLRFMAALLLGLIVAATPGRMWAQESAASSAAIVVADTPITVGDVVPLTIEVHHPAGTVAIVPSLESVWGDFEVRSQGPVEVASEANGLVSRQIVDVALFAPGDYTTPDLTVAVADSSGATTEILAPPLQVVVTSVLTDSDTEPRDIKGQADVFAAFPWSSAVAVAAALALLVLGAMWLWRRKGLGAMLVRTPLQRVLDELDAIAAQNYPEHEEYKKLYLAVSDTVRAFAQRQMGLPLQERTTAEMRQLLRYSRVPQETIKQMLTLFNECDLVKFSQVTPTPESAAALLVEARDLVTRLASELNTTVSAPSSQPVAETQVHG